MCSMGCRIGTPKIEGLKKKIIWGVVLVNKGCKNKCIAIFSKPKPNISKGQKKKQKLRFCNQKRKKFA
jgi:hypothetical protein